MYTGYCCLFITAYLQGGLFFTYLRFFSILQVMYESGLQKDSHGQVKMSGTHRDINTSLGQ